MLKVNDIFESISGEAGGFPQGTWTSFIRLQGCNLSCKWCDTTQAQGEGTPGKDCKELGVYNIVNAGLRHHVLVTGGEPLLQGETVDLLSLLSQRGHLVQVETNGSQTIPLIPPNVHWVIDRKTPSSGMEMEMPSIRAFAEQVGAIRQHGAHAYIKWVVSDEVDVEFVIREMESLIYFGVTAPFIISPAHKLLMFRPRGFGIQQIAETIRARNHMLLDHVIFSIQLHKLFKLP